MKIGIVVLLVAIYAATASAQTARGGFVGVGSHNADVSELNARLAARGYPEFSDNFLSLSGGFNWWTRKLVWSIDGHGLFQPMESSESYDTRLTAAYGLVSIGLPLRPSRQTYLYPMFSMGGGGGQLSIQARSDVSFDELLANPGRTADVSNTSMLFGPRLGMHFFIRLGENNGAPRGMIIGLRGGYLFSAFESEWSEVDNLETVNGGPKLNLAGPHLMVVIGGWGQKPGAPPRPAR